MDYRGMLRRLDASDRKEFIAQNDGYVAVLTFVAQCMDENPSPRTQQMRDILDQAIQYIEQILNEPG